MALQKKVLKQLVPGIVGEFSDDSPKTGRSYLTYGKFDQQGRPRELPVFGKMFSFTEQQLDSGSSAKTTCAKQGVTANTWAMGILVNPKEHYQIGFDNIGKTMPLAKDGNGNYIPGSATIATRGHIWVMASTKTRAGGYVYADANGNLGDSTLANSVKVVGAHWLRTVAMPTGATEVLSEIAIDNPVLLNQSGGESV